MYYQVTYTHNFSASTGHLLGSLARLWIASNTVANMSCLLSPPGAAAAYPLAKQPCSCPCTVAPRYASRSCSSAAADLTLAGPKYTTQGITGIQLDSRQQDTKDSKMPAICQQCFTTASGMRNMPEDQCNR